MRSLDGRLLRVEAVWVAEAERYDGELAVASACGPTADDAWAALRVEIDASRITTLHRVRVAAR